MIGRFYDTDLLIVSIGTGTALETDRTNVHIFANGFRIECNHEPILLVSLTFLGSFSDIKYITNYRLREVHLQFANHMPAIDR